MAKTPVTMKVDGYKDREVMMVTYEFDQETDIGDRHRRSDGRHPTRRKNHCSRQGNERWHT